MCGRFSVTSDPLTQLLMALVGLAHPGPDNLNVAPTETVPVLRLGADGEPQLVPMRWWLTPFWSKDLSTKYSMYNAKSETAATSAAFKMPYQKQRCVVPISGFYEWCREHGQKVPYFIAPKSQDGMLLAGLWDRWRVPDGTEASTQEFLSFTILTTAAHRRMEVVHHRQPVMLSNEEAIAWLDMDQSTADLAYLFASRLPHALEAVPVSTHVNNARNKDDRCNQAIGHGSHIPSAVSTINAREERQ